MTDPIKREVEELLQKIDSFVPEAGKAPERIGDGRRASHRNWSSRMLKSISLNHLMMLCALVVLATFFVRSVPGTGWVMLVAVAICVTAFAFSLSRSRSTSGMGTTPKEKRWRGQPIDLSEPGGTHRLSNWLRTRRRHRT